MARKKDSKGNPLNKRARFTPLEHWLRDSPAFQSLDAGTRYAYLEFRGKYNGRNNGGITMSIRELAKLTGYSVKKAHVIKKELVEKGFLVIMKNGSFNHKVSYDEKEAHRASIYLLTELKQDEPQTADARKDFMRWKPKQKEEENRQEKA